MQRYLEDQSRALTIVDNDAADDEPHAPVEKPTPEQLEMFKRHLKEWIAADVALKDLQKRALPIRKHKNELSETITEFMRKFNIEDINTRECRIRCTVKRTRPPVKNNDIKRKLCEHFDEDNVNTVFESLAQSAPIKQRPMLRRITIT
jgi:hypothetical protein